MGLEEDIARHAAGEDVGGDDAAASAGEEPLVRHVLVLGGLPARGSISPQRLSRTDKLIPSARRASAMVRRLRQCSLTRRWASSGVAFSF